MAGGANVVLDKGYLAGAALTAFRVVKIGSAADQVIHTAATTDQPIGVTQENATAGDVTNGRVVNVRMMGISKCRAAAALATPGVAVGADTAGRIIASSGVLPRVGILLTTAGATDDLVDVLLCIGAVAPGT